MASCRTRRRCGRLRLPPRAMGSRSRVATSSTAPGGSTMRRRSSTIAAWRSPTIAGPISSRMRRARAVAPGQWLNLVASPARGLGLLIGADLEPPEPARALALAGRRCCWCPRASGRSAPARSRGPAAARAFENGCAIAFANGDPDAMRPPAGSSARTATCWHEAAAAWRWPRCRPRAVRGGSQPSGRAAAAALPATLSRAASRRSARAPLARLEPRAGPRCNATSTRRYASMRWRSACVPSW